MKLKFNRVAMALILTCGLSIAWGLQAERIDHRNRSGSAAGSPNCYDPGDPTEVRLWEGDAPGATGNDPCRDIPYMRVFRPAAGAGSPSAAILIIPGGGYDRLTDTKEQEPVAEYFSRTLHVTAFVLYYRLVQRDGTYRYPVPMWDGQRALKLIRSKTTRYGIDPERLALFGFSAGGHLASTLTLHSATEFGLPTHDAVDNENGRPNLLGLGYPVISMDPADVPPSGSYRNLLRGFTGPELAKLQVYLSGEKNVTPRTPPVFLFESMDDAVISPENSVLFVQALKERGISVDAHLFAHGKHGAGLATDVPEESAWPGMFEHWLAQQHFISK
ncbi:alpha/beta hydrolase [Granulicella sp. L60]|uniref:alpha/beta hydrolase n=1 Tax=Granulicella sp. L60 TaxID=1641866 RepID=UPI00352A739C